MKVEIAVKLVLDSPVSVGTGALADSVADKPIIKAADRTPLIPGSTLKGRTRHACEQVARALYGEKWQWSDCVPPRDFCAPGNLCPVCRIFGTPALPGTVKFSDLRLALAPGLPDLPSDEWQGSATRTEIRVSVSLSRARRTAQEDLLFSIEAHRPGEALVYTGSIRGTVAERREAALLVAGLNLLRAVGGGKSRGLGWGRIEANVALDGASVSATDLMKEVEQWSD